MCMIYSFFHLSLLQVQQHFPFALSQTKWVNYCERYVNLKDIEHQF